MNKEVGLPHLRPLSLLELLTQLDDGNLSPQDVLSICADSIAAHENEIQAFADIELGFAREAAERASGPLAGIPVGVKDIFDTHDFPTCHGSPIYKQHQPLTDAALVNMLRSAGCVLQGKTTTTEFAYLEPSKSRNPHNIEHTPGGSSAGSAAGVAAGFFPVAIGSQTGGSVVRPASYCGVSGFKPSFRLLPTTGMKCFSWSLDTAGLFAAKARDNAALLAAITGRPVLVNENDTSNPRIGIIRSGPFPDLDPDMAEAFDTALKIAETAGANLVEVELPIELEAAYHAHKIIQNFEASMACGDEFDRFGAEMSPLLRNTLEEAAEITAEEYDGNRRDAKNGRAKCKDFFNDLDVVIMPSALGGAPHGNASTGSPANNWLWTLLGNPSINVPGLVSSKTNMPLGMQLIGRFGQDAKVLQAAHWLETKLAN